MYNTQSTNQQNDTMRWVMFVVFLVIFILTSLLTLGAVFFNLGNLDASIKNLLVGATILEVIAAIVALFYAMFNMKKESANTSTHSVQIVPANTISNVTEVSDSPLPQTIKLDRPMAIENVFQGITSAFQNYTISTGFTSDNFMELFRPEQLIFLPNDNIDFGKFRPNVVLTSEKNPLLNGKYKTLAEYIEDVGSQIDGMFYIRGGKRQIRTNDYDAGVQWYIFSLEKPEDTNKEDAKNEEKSIAHEELIQFQKFVLSRTHMAVLTVTYHSLETHPKYVKVLAELIDRFGSPID